MTGFRGRKTQREARERERRERRRREISAQLVKEGSEGVAAADARAEPPKTKARPKAEAPKKPGGSKAAAKPSASPKIEAETPPKAKSAKKRGVLASLGRTGSKPKARTKPKERPAPAKPRAAKPQRRPAPAKSRPGKPTRTQSRPKTLAQRAKAVRSRLEPGLASGRKAAGEGLKATRRRAKAAQPALAKGFARASAIAAPIAAVPFLILASAEKGLRAATRLAAASLTASTRWLDRVLTPQRGTFAVIIAACICLVISQSKDFSGVEVGQPGYAGLSGIVEPERVNLQTPVDAHGVWLYLIAVISAGLAVVALWTGRWRLGGLISVAGLAGVAVTLFSDRGKGLDEGEAAIAFAGTNAVLLEGFFAQLAACGVLAVAGVLLSLHLKRVASTPAAVTASGRSGGSRRKGLPSLAGSRT